MAESSKVRRVEWATTALLAVAAVATAWSSYQANRWNGEQAKAASTTNAIRIDAARAQGEAEAESEVDVALFVAWVNANGVEDEDLAGFYEERFRVEFQPAFEAWLSTDPLANPDAPASPFAMPEYQLESRQQADDLDQQAEASAAIVRRNIQRAANYVLAVVLFAVALFFAGISTKLESERPRLALVIVGWVVFVGTVAWIATFPISFAV